MSTETTRRIVDRLQYGFPPKEAPLSPDMQRIVDQFPDPAHRQEAEAGMRDALKNVAIPPEMIERVVAAFMRDELAKSGQWSFDGLAIAAIRAVRAWDYGK